MKIVVAAIVMALGSFTFSAFGQTAKVEQSSAVSGMTVRISAFSGKPVPRFESLKYAAVHGRTGPSLEYPIAWRYERQGLPVMVVKESRDWRMVRDPSGDEVWMHARTLGGQPSVLIFGDAAVDLKSHPKANSRVIARMEPGNVATLIGCEGAFCQVYVQHRKGWAAKSQLWGAPGTSAQPVERQLARLSAPTIESD
ncbi:SH3 domain-containing protein [Ponticaulis profundi]|uniref:SH3 domain-containing protein n=1 Tax=Ponticaulis profundi TaxID=2665222 RepID=A0ABW1SDB9_9PROT